MKIGSLFSGIGGLDLGLERAGVGQVVWQVEADPFCRSVLARHWPEATIYEDVREVRGGAVEPVDVLCGGFPCQDVSNAGKRAGLDGERSGLWYEFDRLVGELRPRFVVVENVAALLGRGGPEVVRTLASRGYGVWWDCVPAAAVGAPHRRDRLFLVAWRLGDRIGDGLEGQHVAGPAARAALVAGRARSPWAIERGLGGVADGLSAGVDGVMWPTPTASLINDDEDIAAWETRREATRARVGNGNGFSTPLTVAARMWPTPTSNDRLDAVYQRSGDAVYETLPGAVGGAKMPEGARRFRPVAAWEGDVPRTIVVPAGDREASRLRKARLRALGNAVVPQVAEIIGHVVVALARLGASPP